MLDAHSFRLDGRLALVTGSSTGIGLALARGLAQSGAAVVLNGRDAGKLSAAAAALGREGFSVHRRAFDTSDPDAVAAAVASIEQEIGAIDILINNAGIARRGMVHEMSLAEWRAVQATNVDGLFIVGQAVARHMVARRSGRIINICSVMSELSRPGAAAYSTSKGAAKMLTKAMAVDLAPHGINVNGIAPGYFRTDMTAGIAADDKLNAWIVERTPLKRWGEVDELAGAAVFLSSPASRYVTGHVLTVDGGMTATL